MAGKIKNLKGQKFGMLTPIETTKRTKKGNRIWTCICDCGEKVEVLSTSLISGNTKSCGCVRTKKLIARNSKHGKAGTRIHRIWCRMNQRCRDKNTKDYPLYGGRGISVCAEWLEFEAFYRWAIANGYDDKLSIDRKDSNGNYEPDNCQWVTAKVQANNTSRNHFVEFQGQRKTLSEWSREMGISTSLLRYRLKRGKSLEQVFKN